MDFNNYKFRASQLGLIMSGVPKTLTEKQKETLDAYDLRYKGEGRPLTEKQKIDYYSLLSRKNAKCMLSDGAKTHLEKLVWDHVTGRSLDIQNKYTEKGLTSEERSITLYSEVENKLFIKNKERKENEYFTGECDNAQGKIRDIKSSWSYVTFPLTARKIENKLYDWQLQVYMNLWGMKEAELIYCLVDTPSKLVDDELRKLDWKFNIFDQNGDVRSESRSIVVECVSNLLFTFEALKKYCFHSATIEIDWFEGHFKELPPEIRIKVFQTSYSEKMISNAIEMVVLARDYMNSVLVEMGDNVLKYNELNNQAKKVA